MNDLLQSSSGHLNGLKAEKSVSITAIKTVTATTSTQATNSNITTVPSSAQEFVDSKNGLQKKKKSANIMPTIRFELNLEPPTSEKFSEFNYNKLVVKTIKIVKKKSKAAKSTSMNGTLNEIQKISKNDLTILAGELLLERCKISSLLSHYRKKVILSKEEETNENNLLNTDLACETNDGFNESGDRNGELNNDDNSMDSEGSIDNMPMKNKKSKKKSNLYDSENNQYKLKDFNYLGQGYDEDDSFIDNSEAIDERVPADMAPKKGGFYINKGNLKMEKIEEQRAKAKLAKKQAKKQNIKKLEMKKEKPKNDSNGNDSSTDEDFNPEEMDEDAAGNDEDMSDSDENEDSDSDSDSDSDDESYESDDEESEEIDEVSEIEDQNLDEIKLRNKKLIKTDAETNLIKNINDSSCEVIEISSNSNSNQSSKRQNKNKKRRINDDDEQDGVDDDTAGKENIEAGNNQPTASSSDNNKRRKRIKDSGSGSGDSSNMNSEVEVAANLPGSSKQIQKSQEPAEVVKGINQLMNFSSRLKELIDSFVTEFNASNSLNVAGGNVWTDELKAMLFRIYQEIQTPLERSNMFTYISNKTGKTREVLMRHCRNQSSKLLNGGAGSQMQQSQVQQPQPQQQQQQTQALNRLPVDSKTAYCQKIEENSSFNKPKVLNDLSEDLRLKLENLEKLFTAFKQTNEPISKFFDQAKSSNIIYNIDAQTKVTAHSKNCRQTRDLVLDVMSKTLEITRDRLLEGLQRIRIKHINNVIQNKINILKRDIDDEMPKQIAKYKQAFDEYIKSKAVYEAALQANSDIEKKKILPPRKKFEWTVKIRDIYLQIVNLKMSTYRSSSKPPIQSPAKQTDPTSEETAKRNEYLQNFLKISILPLWLESWMQLNVLLNMSNSKSGNPASQLHQSRAPPPSQSSPSANKTPNSSFNSPNVQNKPFVTNGSIINLASKSGKRITLEHQPLGKPQQPPSHQLTPARDGNYSSPTMTMTPQPAKSNSKPATPSQLNRSLQLNNDNKNSNKSKVSPPIINLTNTRPTGSTSLQQHQVSPSGSGKKLNIQFNNNTVVKNNTQTTGNAKLSPNTLQLQQQQLQYLQQHFDLNIFNATGNLVSPSGTGGTNGQLASIAYHLNNFKNPSNN